MPMVSQAQRAYLHIHHPEIAARWEKHTPKGKKLPKHVKKKADLGGDGNETSFEQAFADISHIYIRDKAPGLLDYEVGFQLVERSEDDDRAMGVLGYKVGDEWLYVPIFYLSGDVKGHELLWLKSQDRFVPLKEGWLNRVLNRRPDVLGESVPRNSTLLGVRAPDLQAFARAPLKFASCSVEGWAADAVQGFARVLLSNPTRVKAALSLPEFLKAAGPDAIAVLAHDLRAYPELRAPLERFHGKNLLQGCLAHCKQARLEKEAAQARGVLKAAGPEVPHGAAGDPPTPGARYAPPSHANGAVPSHGQNAWRSLDGYRPRKGQHANFTAYLKGAGVLSPQVPADPLVTGALQIIKRADFKLHGDLTKKERELLVDEGLVVRDERKEATRLYNVQGRLKLTNPTRTGTYDVLLPGGAFARCLVVVAPHSHRGREEFCTILKLEGEGRKDWVNAHSGHVWAKPVQEDKYDEWLAKQPEADSLAKGATYVLVGPNGEGSVPVDIEGPALSGPGGRCYPAHFCRYSCMGRPDHLPPSDRSRLEVGRPQEGGPYLTLAAEARGGTVLRALGGELVVPQGYKAVKCSEEEEGGDNYKGNYDFALGDEADLRRVLFDKLASLEVRAIDGGAYVNGRRFVGEGAFIHLVARHGLRAEAARGVLKAAAASPSRRVECRVKYAGPYDLLHSAPAAPAYPDPPTGNDPMSAGAATLYPQQFAQQVPFPMTDRQIYNPMTAPQPDPLAAQVALRAGQTGQKEVFDTALISRMLKAVRDDTMIDSHVGPLSDAIDHLGRLLFSFYWHADRWEERFGKSNLPSLEDSLRNNFEDLGDLVLELSESEVGGSEDEMARPGLDRGSDI